MLELSRCGMRTNKPERYVRVCVCVCVCVFSFVDYFVKKDSNRCATIAMGW